MKISLLLLLLATPCFAISDVEVSRIADGIYAAEGGSKARVAYGILSVKTKNPRQTCLNTIRNSWGHWSAAGCPGDFLDFLGKRYAPVGAANDPSGLNVNWTKNVRARMPARRRNFSIQ